MLWKSDESNSDFQCPMRSYLAPLLEYEEHSRQRNSSRYRKNANYLEEHDMEWHGDYVRQKPGPKIIGINKILVSQFECDLFTHTQEFIQ
jgi:hypothetical protein